MSLSIATLLNFASSQPHILGVELRVELRLKPKAVFKLFVRGATKARGKHFEISIYLLLPHLLTLFVKFSKFVLRAHNDYTFKIQSRIFKWGRSSSRRRWMKIAWCSWFCISNSLSSLDKCLQGREGGMKHWKGGKWKIIEKKTLMCAPLSHRKHALDMETVLRDCQR